ncbi:MAG: DUF1573 domain-containing protein [Bacteroidota bacterium]
MPATKRHSSYYLQAVIFAPLLSCLMDWQGSKQEHSVIQFEATTISFDTINAGEKIAGEFVFKNSSDDPLDIMRVQASDGGTIANWPEQPIMPGAKGVIKVEFGFTESRQGYQDKSFTVISNAYNNPVMLHWKGYIKK